MGCTTPAKQKEPPTRHIVDEDFRIDIFYAHNQALPGYW
jgi:hypothetical protein